MFQIPLAAVSNQSVSFNVDGAFWQVKIYQAVSTMCADIRRNGQDVIRGVRCFSGVPLMPFPYMYTPLYGNFVFDAQVDWTAFGATCALIYLNNQEFASYMAIYNRGKV